MFMASAFLNLVGGSALTWHPAAVGLPRARERPTWRKNIGRRASKTVPAARGPLRAPLARRLAFHACRWHDPLQQGAMSMQKPPTRFKKALT